MQAVQQTTELTCASGPWGALGAEDFLSVLLSVRCALLRLEFLAVTSVRLDGFCGPKLAGAAWHGLRELSETAEHPQLRFLARTAFRMQEPMEVRSGIRARPFVLGVPPGSVALSQGETLAFEVVLFGEAAETWPAWAAALERIRLGSSELELARAIVSTPEGSLDVAELPPGLGCVLRLEDLAPAMPDGGAQRLAIELLTPTTVEDRTDFLSRERTLALFLRAALLRLRAVAAVDLSALVERELMAAAAATRIIRDHTRPQHVRHWSSRTRTEQVYPALVGRFECVGPVAELLPFLAFGQLTHVGKHSAWGMGRYALLDAES